MPDTWRYLFAQRSKTGVWTIDGDPNINPVDGDEVEKFLAQCEAAGWEQVTYSDRTGIFILKQPA